VSGSWVRDGSACCEYFLALHCGDLFSQSLIKLVFLSFHQDPLRRNRISCGVKREHEAGDSECDGKETYQFGLSLFDLTLSVPGPF